MSRPRHRPWVRIDDARHADTLLARIPSLPRAALERVAQMLIDHLDEIDGDPDREYDGDELDGTAGEDDFYPHSNWLDAPGCPIADPDSAVDDQAGAPRSEENCYA